MVCEFLSGESDPLAVKYMKNLNGKSVKMLLVYPDYTDRDCTQKESGGNYSEGLASISAVLKQGGHDVKLLHLKYLHTEEIFKKKMQELGAFDIVGFSIRTTAFPDSKLYMKWTKEVYPDTFIICGSYHATLVPDEVIAYPDVDAVCIGEGEYAELELCDKMRDGEDYTNIESIWFKLEDGSIKKNPVRQLCTNLDELPIPDFDLFDYDNLESVRVNTAIVMMSRGCLFSCTYCGNGQLRKVYPPESRKKYARFRSPENAMLYLKTLLSKHPQIKYLNFRDAIFNMYPDWFDTFIEMYKAEIHLPFTCNVRFDILTEDHVRKLKEAGCYTIDVGLESGDYEIRTKYLKRMQTDEMIINACKWFTKYGVTTLTYNIVGLPHEDLHRALKTIKLNARIKSNQNIPNIFYPYPMTELYDIAKEAGFLPEVIEPDCRVPLIQKQFPKHHVLFVADYFMYYVKRYRFAFEHNWKWYEKWLDFWFTGPITPRRTLVFLADTKNKMYRGLKRFLINKLPSLYVKLRKQKIKKATKKKEKESE